MGDRSGKESTKENRSARVHQGRREGTTGPFESEERLATFFDFFPDFLTDFLALFRLRSFRNRLRCGLKQPSTPERA